MLPSSSVLPGGSSSSTTSGKFSVALPTLDEKHREFMAGFQQNEQDHMPRLKQEKKELRRKLRTGSCRFEVQMQYELRISEIDRQIKEMKEKKRKYVLENCSFIFNYFESKKNIALPTPISSSSSDLTATTQTAKNNQVLQFFKLVPTHSVSTDDAATTTTKNGGSVNPNLNPNPNPNPMTTVANVTQQYLSSVDTQYLDPSHFIHSVDICTFCHKGEYQILEENGKWVCTSCMRTIPYLVENDKTSYKEPPKEICVYAYKPINHFKEILTQFQAKETTQIPNEVFKEVRKQIIKERVTEKELNGEKMKEILRKEKLSKYYEHRTYIKSKLGFQSPHMSAELEETLCNLFIEIQGPYARFCPTDRTNFLNYSYTAYKLCELLEEREYLPYFSMLKDPKNRREQDDVWKKICDALGWTFIPTP